MTTNDIPPLLEVSGLSVSYEDTEVVHDVSFTLERGQAVGIIGESGSGKSSTARAILRLLAERRTNVGGKILLHGRDLQKLRDGSFRHLRGSTLGFVPQDPANSLNPVRTIGSQAHEAAALRPDAEPDSSSVLRPGRHRRSVNAREKQLILDIFDRVGLDDPQQVYDSYPHQLSGGMLQRVLIGLAVLPEPEIIVADEPTSALDVTIQRRILDILDTLRAELGIGLILITHDLAVAAERTDSLVVLRGGSVVESGPTSTVLRNPSQAYTVNLRESVPALNPERYARRRETRGDQVPDAAVAVDGISRTFTTAGRSVAALSELSFHVPRGTTHALVGESGSGKTTAIRILTGLEAPDAGSVRIGDRELVGLRGRERKAVYRQLQLVYQNPFTSLDPSWSVGRIVREPLDRFRVGDRNERRDRSREALGSVGLDDSVLGRRASTLSGGQRQRVAIARALVLRPEVLVLDEPTSALDVSVQAEIFDLLFELQVSLGLTYVVVSHDLALIRQVADTVTVMRRGAAVESGPVAHVFGSPEHEYTRALLAATPTYDSLRQSDAVLAAL
jgi:peptide/nickel transport system ATP-binding protein